MGTLLESLNLGAGKGNADAESLLSSGFLKTGLGLLRGGDGSCAHDQTSFKGRMNPGVVKFLSLQPGSNI